ncbi:MAG TPA: amidohydrolase family protein [Actinomycetota bacterium]
MIIDGDQHVYEPRDCWRARIDPAFRDDALAIEDDDLGYAWLTHRGRKLYLAEIQRPGKAKPIGEERLRIERGEPADGSYDELLPIEYTDPDARIKQLDLWGIDEAILLPNFGLLWEEMLEPPARLANMRAYNRWIAETTADARLHGVAHVSLADAGWLDEELATLSAGGVRLAMVAPSPVGGRALGHPDLDPVWSSFTEHGVSPIFHVGGFRQPLDPALFADDPEPVDKVIASALLWVAPATALAHMAVHGAFQRHPDLRVGVIELTAHWVPQFMLMLDGAWGFYAARHGRPLTELPLRPSEYVARQVRVGALAYESPARLIEQAGDLFMYGSDWPHAEGIAEPLATYEGALDGLPDERRGPLMGGNVEWLLGR